MSRSNPTENSTPNPAVRWFEWNGEHGLVRYYDKDTKKNVDVGADFKFMLLDQLGSVRGWHDASESGIYSNEVKDTRADVLIVKAFKYGTIAEGFYQDIKLKVNAAGGQFTTNCYIAFKMDNKLTIGSLRIKGAALGAWMDFVKAHRADLYKQAVRITGFNEGKKGRIVYRVPIFELFNVSPETNQQAEALDATFQAFLTTYLKRTTSDRAEAPHLRDESAADHDTMQEPDPPQDATPDDHAVIFDDDIPF